MFNLVLKIYRKKYNCYKKLRDKATSKAVKYLLDGDMTRYQMYMDKCNNYSKKIVKVTKEAEEFMQEYGA